MNIEAIKTVFSEELFSTFDKLKCGILFTDDKKNIIYANKNFLKFFGTDLDLIKNTKCWELMHPDSPCCEACKDDNSIHLKVSINGGKYNILISNSQLDGNIEMAIVYNVTKIMSKIDKLNTEMDSLKEIIKNTFGSYKFLIACSDCQKIRLEDGTWVNPADINALMEKTGISHGLCPECAKPYLEGLLKNKK